MSSNNDKNLSKGKKPANPPPKGSKKRRREEIETEQELDFEEPPLEPETTKVNTGDKRKKVQSTVESLQKLV